MGVHLFLSPHLDDAILSCGGLMHRLAKAGERVIIVTAMAGDPQEPLPDSSALHLAHSSVADRRIADAQAAQQLHAQVYHLTLPESDFRKTLCGAGDWIALYPTDESRFGPIDDADDARIILFETRLPFSEVLTIYAPFGVDPHVDHRLVRDWALVLTGAQDAPPLKFYEEYPYARSPSAVQHAQAFYHQQLPAISIESEVVMLDEDDQVVRLRAMRCYLAYLRTLWQDAQEMERHTRDYLFTVGDGRPAERFWRVVR